MPPPVVGRSWTADGMTCPSVFVGRGEVSERFAEPLEGVVVELACGQSILRIEIVDQAKLHAILGWLFDHGVDLVSLFPAAEATPDGVAPGD